MWHFFVTWQAIKIAYNLHMCKRVGTYIHSYVATAKTAIGSYERIQALEGETSINEWASQRWRQSHAHHQLSPSFPNWKFLIRSVSTRVTCHKYPQSTVVRGKWKRKVINDNRRVCWPVACDTNITMQRCQRFFCCNLLELFRIHFDHKDSTNYLWALKMEIS